QDWRNRRAMGFDMYSEPNRREALDRARRTGEPAATGRVRLVQETDIRPQFGSLIYIPVHHRVPPGQGDARAETLRGFVYAPFRAGDFFGSLIGPAADRAVSFSIYDGPAPAPDALFFVNHGVGASRAHRHAALRHLDVAGRRWTLAFRSTDAL